MEAVPPSPPAALYAWKFIVRARDWKQDPVEPELSYRGCVAVALAPDEAEARRLLEQYAQEMGMDARWLRGAEVKRLNATPGVMCWAEV